MDATLVLGQQGRGVIPADIRNALGLSPGDRLHLQVTRRRMVIEPQQDAVSELRPIGVCRAEGALTGRRAHRRPSTGGGS